MQIQYFKKITTQQQRGLTFMDFIYHSHMFRNSIATDESMMIGTINYMEGIHESRFCKSLPRLQLPNDLKIDSQTSIK